MSIRVLPGVGFSLGSLVVIGLLYFKLHGLSKSERSTATPHIGRGGAEPADLPWSFPPGTRHLSELQVKAFENRLKPFASQRFWVIAETGEVAPQAEEARFGEELRNALVRAGWLASQKVRQRMGRAGFQERTMYRYSHGGDSGLVIFAAPDSMRAGTALNSAVSRMLFRTSVERDDNLQHAILIFVGSP